MKKTSKLVGGTSYFGTIIMVTPNQLKKVAKKLGADYWEKNNGRDKTNYDFEFETNCGKVFTVYDWKYYKPLITTRSYPFHIGGFSLEETQLAKQELKIEIATL